jgi:hypothetical protein
MVIFPIGTLKLPFKFGEQRSFKVAPDGNNRSIILLVGLHRGSNSPGLESVGCPAEADDVPIHVRLLSPVVSGAAVRARPGSEAMPAQRLHPAGGP